MTTTGLYEVVTSEGDWKPAGLVGEHPQMTDDADRRGPFPQSPKRVRFAELPGGAMTALLDGDLSEAGRVAGVPQYGSARPGGVHDSLRDVRWRLW
ncbi:hypothetical protein [Streptomyces pharetrae]|uniref:hypothetical protein n=1 Tax=Streptomyces pharetrae TaxID=291370 RepID=UPI0026CC682C